MIAYQAIQTKYLCPTNTKGPRYKAWCQRGSIVVSADPALNIDNNHINARKALIAKFIKEDIVKYGSSTNPWDCEYIMAYLPDGSACHVKAN